MLTKSDQINELAAALAKAQGEMGGAAKDSKNPFFKSRYADLASIVRAVKDPLAANGLSYTQFPLTCDKHVGVTTVLMHSSGQFIQSEYTIPLQKLDPQAVGSAITYARRYALQAIVGIPATDDDAELAMVRDDEPRTKSHPAPTCGQIFEKAKEVFGPAAKAKILDRMQNEYGATASNQLKPQDLSSLMAWVLSCEPHVESDENDNTPF